MVNIYKLKLTNLQQKILRLLFVDRGKVLNQRQTANLLNVSGAAIIKALPGLVEEDLIVTKQDKETKRWAIELNSDNHRTIQLKRVDNLKMIYESGLADFLEREFAGAAVILFGSYSRGEDTITSDIDLAVIGRKEKSTRIEEYEKILKRKIIINFYPSFKNIHKHLKESILNGIILSGSVDL
ncbi:nucleotidyltransferase domain-containing protein [Candidatus Pacearchaeota archaeon]|nr:nucleotidyltransferase domain-containing protein [Candidatus Pacearchaeota archaeon]